jgi:hypothetical protein
MDGAYLPRGGLRGVEHGKRRERLRLYQGTHSVFLVPIRTTLIQTNDVIRPVIKSAGERRKLRSWEALQSGNSRRCWSSGRTSKNN